MIELKVKSYKFLFFLSLTLLDELLYFDLVLWLLLLNFCNFFVMGLLKPMELLVIYFSLPIVFLFDPFRVLLHFFADDIVLEFLDFIFQERVHFLCFG